MALEKRKVNVNAHGPGGEMWVDDDFMADWPNVFAFLMDQKWADGTVRVPGSISLFCTNGVLKAAVNDKDRGLVAFLSAPTFPELMTLIDLGICKDSLDWRAGGGFNTGKRPPY